MDSHGAEKSNRDAEESLLGAENVFALRGTSYKVDEEVAQSVGDGVSRRTNASK
jgi:hypothetical protein